MKQRKDLIDMAFALLVVGLSLYPLYRDDVAKWKNYLENKFRPRDPDRQALAQVRREISLMEHGDGA